MDLITITKDGVKLAIHPAALDEHKRLGWLQMPDEPEQAEPARRTRKKPDEPEQAA